MCVHVRVCVSIVLSVLYSGSGNTISSYHRYLLYEVMLGLSDVQSGGPEL